MESREGEELRLVLAIRNVRTATILKHHMQGGHMRLVMMVEVV